MVVVALCVVYLAILALHYQTGLREFIWPTLTGKAGYDGQFNYAIAADPLHASPALDVPAYRYQRILYPLLVRALALGQEDRYAGFKLLARKVYDHFETTVSKWAGNKERVGLPPWETLNRTVLNEFLDPQQGAPYAARAIIRTQLGMPAETNTPAISTNAIVPSVLSDTNVPASTNK